MTTSFSLHETENTISLTGGLSAEICFAKYIAFCKKKIYVGHNSKTIVDVSVSKSILFDTLINIVKTVENNYYQQKNFALISPGFCSVPYIVELMNALYLPSHLLISFKKISELREALYHLKTKNIDAYAIAGFDGTFGDRIVAWIRFNRVPYLYLELLKKLNITKVLIAGVWSEKETKKRFFYSYESSYENIKPLDIYFYDDTRRYHHHEEDLDPYVPDYAKPEIKSDIKKFSMFISDFNPQLLNQKNLCKDILSWESGFENPHNFLNNFLNNFEGETFYMLKNGSKPLFELSSLISQKYIEINNIKQKGLVLNGYFANNPTYETAHGYIGYCGYYSNSNLFSEILTFLKKHIDVVNDKTFLFWINDLRSSFYTLCKYFPSERLFYINDENSQRKNLYEWIIKHSRKSDWEDKKYVDLKYIL